LAAYPERVLAKTARTRQPVSGALHVTAESVSSTRTSPQWSRSSVPVLVRWSVPSST